MIAEQEERAEEPEQPRQSRRSRRGQTRKALLDAAERLWAERGIRGVSLDEIAGYAGLTKGAVYSNFGGKTDLLLALLERYTEADAGLDPPGVLGDPSLPRVERLATAGRQYARRLNGDEARLRAMLIVELWLYGMRDYAAGWRVADWFQQRRTHLAADLVPDDGALAIDERATLAMAIEFGLAFQHLLDPERVAAELYVPGLDLILGQSLQ